MPAAEIDIDLEEPDSWPLPAATLVRVVEEAARAALAEAGPGGDAPLSVTIALSGNGRVRELNREWRGRDRPTNVLSFPASADMPLPEGVPRPLGDIVLAGPVVAREAEEAGVPLEEQLAWMVIHGMLHLLGHDHLDDDERRRMEELERRSLARLGLADPYAGAET